MRAHLTPQAEIDLEEIGDYIALDNPKRAVSFIREVRQHCEKIADGPRRYVARPDLGDAIRICAHGNSPERASRPTRWAGALGRAGSTRSRRSCRL
jgi:plasmid stabilization system protein ParE